MKKQWLQYGLLALGIINIIYNVVLMVSGGAKASQQITIIVETLAGMALIFVPQLADRLLHIKISPTITWGYLLFLLISVFIGTGWDMYNRVSFWDKILHAVSPAILTMVGYALLTHLLSRVPNSGSLVGTYLIFGFAFAGICGIGWEFWEFSWDHLLNMNLQRYMGLGGEALVGRAALMDTMSDFFWNTTGAVIMLIYSAIRSHMTANYFDRYYIVKRH
ncbi:MAG: hypothetical protein MR008_04540 [Aerococcus sp.]|nr:hypothetical protein [Aerococcus sp.]